MSLRTRRLAATLVATFVATLGLTGAALISTLGTSTFLAGCPDPRTCGEPNLTHSAVVAASQPRTLITDCPDPDNCTPPR